MLALSWCFLVIVLSALHRADTSRMGTRKVDPLEAVSRTAVFKMELCDGRNRMLSTQSQFEGHRNVVCSALLCSWRKKLKKSYRSVQERTIQTELIRTVIPFWNYLLSYFSQNFSWRLRFFCKRRNKACLQWEVGDTCISHRIMSRHAFWSSPSNFSVTISILPLTVTFSLLGKWDYHWPDKATSICKMSKSKRVVGMLQSYKKGMLANVLAINHCLTKHDI